MDDVGPFQPEGHDEPLGLAVGLQSEGLGADGYQIQCPAGLSPVTGVVGGAAIRENPAAGDPLLGVPAVRTGQKPNGRRLLLVSDHLDVGQADGVVDREWTFS